jgi:hypothetical protein
MVATTNLEKTLSMRLQHVLHEWKIFAQELKANGEASRDLTRRYYTSIAAQLETKLNELLKELPKIEYEEVS